MFVRILLAVLHKPPLCRNHPPTNKRRRTSSSSLELPLPAPHCNALASLFLLSLQPGASRDEHGSIVSIVPPGRRSLRHPPHPDATPGLLAGLQDRKSTRLNSSHRCI